jgi:hypothetical protein
LCLDSGLVSAATATIATTYDDGCRHTPQEAEIPATANKKITTAVASLGKANGEIAKLADALKGLKQSDQSKLLLQEVKEVLKIGLFGHRKATCMISMHIVGLKYIYTPMQTYEALMHITMHIVHHHNTGTFGAHKSVNTLPGSLPMERLGLAQHLQKMSALGVDEDDKELSFDKIKYVLSEALWADRATHTCVLHIWDLLNYRSVFIPR